MADFVSDLARQGIRMVCRRSGPTETIVTGTPTCRPKNSTYSVPASGGRTIA